MLLGRENIDGEGRSELGDDKGDHDGSAEISCRCEILWEGDAIFDDGKGSAALPGRGLIKAI